MRKKVRVTISAEGRDKGKVFALEEMPAMQVERWERRFIACAVQTGVRIPDDVQGAGLGVILSVALTAVLGMSGGEVEALHDELMACVQIHPDPSRLEVVRPLAPEDIEEPKTVLTLKDEVIKLHTGFSVAASLSRAWAESAARRETMQNSKTSGITQDG